MPNTNTPSELDGTVLGSETVTVEDAPGQGVEIPINDAVVDILGLNGDEYVDISVCVTAAGKLIVNADLSDVDVTDEQLTELETALSDQSD